MLCCFAIVTLYFVQTRQSFTNFALCVGLFIKDFGNREGSKYANRYRVFQHFYSTVCCVDLGPDQKYSRLRCLLHVKGLVFCFYLGWSGSILQFRQNIIKVGSKSWLLTCSSNITFSLPSYTALKKERNFCNGYLSLLYFWLYE